MKEITNSTRNTVMDLTPGPTEGDTLENGRTANGTVGEK